MWRRGYKATAGFDIGSVGSDRHMDFWSAVTLHRCEELVDRVSFNFNLMGTVTVDCTA